MSAQPTTRERMEMHLAENGCLVRIYVWDLVVRITHWLIALSILELSITGIYIGNPYIISAGPAGESFVMGWMKALHTTSLAMA